MMCIKSKNFSSVLSCIIFITVKFVDAEIEALQENIVRYTQDDILEGDEFTV